MSIQRQSRIIFLQPCRLDCISYELWPTPTAPGGGCDDLNNGSDLSPLGANSMAKTMAMDRIQHRKSSLGRHPTTEKRVACRPEVNSYSSSSSSESVRRSLMSLMRLRRM